MAREVLRIVDGWPMWQLPSGRLVPWIAGASTDAGGDPGDDGGDDGDSGQDGPDGGTLTKPSGTRGTGGTPGDDEPEQPPDDWPKEAKDMFRKLRKIADNARREATRASEQLQARQTQGMTEAERQAARVHELETELGTTRSQLKLRTKQEAFREAGIAAKAKSPGTLYRFIDDEAVEWGPDGEILNAPELVQELRRAEQWMFESRGARGSADAAQGQQQQGQPAASFDMNAWLRRTAGTTAQDQR